MNKLLSAVGFAAIKHRDQRRKDALASPYINHPIALANVLANEAGVDDERVPLCGTPHKGTYADLSIMWILDTKRAPTAVDERRARISLSA